MKLLNSQEEEIAANDEEEYVRIQQRIQETCDTIKNHEAANTNVHIEEVSVSFHCNVRDVPKSLHIRYMCVIH